MQTAELRRLAAGQRQRSKHNCLEGGGARVPPGAPAHVLPPAVRLKRQGQGPPAGSPPEATPGRLS